jgi:hypothetical protein
MSQLVQDVAGLYVPPHDYIKLDYVPKGSNGAGELAKATYRSGGAAGTVVAELSLAYDSSNKLVSVTKI